MEVSQAPHSSSGRVKSILTQLTKEEKVSKAYFKSKAKLTVLFLKLYCVEKHSRDRCLNWYFGDY